MFAQQEGTQPKAVSFENVPEKFTQRHDKLGFLWQADNFGALTSGETQYLPSGMKLSVSGVPFQPQSATLKDGTASNGVVDLDLIEKRKGVTIERSLWFDLERGGVRIIDRVTNTGKAKVTLRAEFKTTYPFSWQNLHGMDGKFLKVDPVPILGERDFGVLVRFSQTEGRHDTLFLTSSEKDSLRPVMSASSNNRELVFFYDLALGGGESRSLVHWILQRNLSGPIDVKESLAPFYQGRRLIDSRVPSNLVGSVANFDRAAFPKDGGTPLRLDSLISLNEFIDKIGVHRRDEDILHISANNQLVGKVDPRAEIKVNSDFGREMSVSIRKIAAIQGGGGVGRVPRIFLRDGRVLSGDFEASNLSLKVGDEWTVGSLRPNELNVLLCSLSLEDGVPPPGTGGFLELRSGSVLAVSTKNPSLVSLVTPWRALQLPINKIDELGYVTRPSPRFRLVTPEGSRLTVFVPTETLPLTQASGKILDIPAALISRIWKEGRTSTTTVAEDDYWLDFSEVPEDIRPDNGFLLSGNNILNGTLEGDEIRMIDGASVVRVAVAEIESIQRTVDKGTASHPVFEIELKNGDTLTGELRAPVLKIKEGENLWKIPVAHLIAFHSKKSK